MLCAAHGGQGHSLMIMYVNSAFLSGAERGTDFHAKVGFRRKVWYFNNEAPQIWQSEVRRTLERIGFWRCM